MVLYILLLLWLLVSLTPTCRLYPQRFLPLQTPLGGLISAAANERMLQCKHMYRHHRIRGDHTHILELPARTKQIKTRTLCLNCWAKHLRVSTASIEEYHALRSLCYHRTRCNHSSHAYAPGTRHVLVPRINLDGNVRIVGEYYEYKINISCPSTAQRVSSLRK